MQANNKSTASVEIFKTGALYGVRVNGRKLNDVAGYYTTKVSFGGAAKFTTPEAAEAAAAEFIFE